MLWIAEAIDKNEICVSVNGSGTMKIEQRLPFLCLLYTSLGDLVQVHVAGNVVALGVHHGNERPLHLQIINTQCTQ